MSTGPRPEAQLLRALWIDPDGSVWAGGKTGLYRLRDGEWSHWSADDGLLGSDVLCIGRDVAGRLWVGTEGGAAVLDGDRFRGELSSTSGIPLPVRSLAADPDGSIWFGTYGAGLCWWKDGEARWFTTQSGLPDNSISAVLLLPEDRIAITTNRGYAEVSIAALSASHAGDVCELPWQYSSSASNRTLIEAQGGHQPAATLSADGSVWFSAVKGLAHRAPDLRPPRARPVARIQGLETVGAKYPAAAVALPLGVRDLTVTYTAPSFIDPARLRFRYRLVPLDASWVDAGTARLASYRHLPPGTYEFQVAVHSAGEPDSGADSVRIEIGPYWHERASVRLGAGAALLLTGLLTLRLRSRASRLRALELERVVSERTRQLADEIEIRTEVERELRRNRDLLDERVLERTVELHDANARLQLEMQERIRLQGELLQSQKMDSLGKMAGGIAHDFNNLLTVVNGTAELGGLGVAQDSNAQAAFAEILKAGRTAAHLTRQLLIFARRSTLEPSVQTVERCIQEAQVLLQKSAGANVQLELELEPRPWNVRLPAGHVEQILVNTCINSSEAMPSGGTIRIGTRKRTLGVAEAPPGVEPGDYVELTIQDSGEGMDAATIERALDPFFTTKSRGTGLGLSTCYGIARQAGGTLTVDSLPGQGTSIHVLLSRHLGTERKSPPSLVPRRRSLTILLVDDNDAVRETAQRMLSNAGYRVHSASSGGEALRIVDVTRGALDLALLDVMMPSMSGPDTAARILQLRPCVGVLFMSGSLAGDEQQRLLGSGARVLPKPFTLAELEDSIALVVSA